MPVLAALATALPYITAAWQVGSQYLTKPKKADYVPTGSMYQRYLAHLKSKTTESTVFHQRMRPVLRQIGQQTQKAQRGVDYFTASRKPGGGVEAQMRMGINKQALEAIGIASEKASVAQERVNERTGEQLLRIGVQEEQALQRYQTAKRDWTKRMFATTVSAGINLADVSVRKHIADTKLKLDAAKDAKEAADAFTSSYESAKADLTIPQETTIEQYQDMIETSGYKDPDMMNKYLKSIGAQEAKDIKFQEDIELENIKRQSADELIRIKQYTDEHPEDALAFLRESKTLQRTLTTKDYIAAGKYAAGKATQLYPFENEFTSAVLRDSLKDMKNVADKVYESKATNKVKLSVHRTVQSAKAERIADLERELREADKAETKRLKSEIKGLKFDADKDSILLLLGVEADLHTTYREGENENGKLYSVVGKESIERIQSTLKAISYNKKTGEGMSKSQSVGFKKDIIRWAKAIEFDDQQITLMFGNMSELTANIPRLNEYINTSTTSDMDSRSLTLIKYYLNRIDSLYKQIPYDDTEALVQGTFAE